MTTIATALQRALFTYSTIACLWAFVVARANGTYVLDLGGDNWVLSNANGSISNIRARVPGVVHTDLMAAGIIDDPYYRFNDVEYRWIGLDNWTYEKTFDVPALTLNHAAVDLVCDGIDTISTVYINDVYIGSTDNMFRRYIFDVKKHLQAGANTIRTDFTSPVTYAGSRRKDFRSRFRYDVPPWKDPKVIRGEGGRAWVRKEQSSFGWDWGPCFVPCGIYRPIRLEAYSTAVIRHITTVAKPVERAINIVDGQRWSLQVGVYLDHAVSASGELQASITFNGCASSSTQSDSMHYTKTVAVTPNTPVTNITLYPRACVWWPNGYGEAHLHELTITYRARGETTTIVKRIGFRTAELHVCCYVHARLLFRINSVPIFFKGANWVPADAFAPRVTHNHVRSLLAAAREAHHVGVRVWGGGIYERDTFYEAADELGLLVWQEFMFACSMYPADEAFLTTVAAEVEDQVLRLQHHPSIVVWSGNNENEDALAKNWWNMTKINHSRYEDDYRSLYVATISKKVAALDASRPFVTSSPSNGDQSIAHDYIADDPQDQHYGDMHYYNYTDICTNVSTLPTPRFASEYGWQASVVLLSSHRTLHMRLSSEKYLWQSWPSAVTLEPVSTQHDRVWNSKFMQHRQHHDDGDHQMLWQIRQHFALRDAKELKEPTAYKRMLYLTQIMQSLCVKTQSEHYRRNRANGLNGDDGTMGAIYWQLNDVWQGASWSGLEWTGRWKALHYFSKRFFAPILVSMYKHDGTCFVYVVNDNVQPSPLRITIGVQQWSSFTPLWEHSFTVLSHGLTATAVYRARVSQLLGDAGCVETSCFITATATTDAFIREVTDVDFNLGNSTTNSMLIFPATVSESFLVPTFFKEVSGLRAPRLTVEVAAGAHDKKLVVIVCSEAVALFVWLETPLAGHFSDNGFLMHSPVRQLAFVADAKVSMDELKSSLTVMSLYDTL
eukprot:jgi/Chlat1/5900/Chrsp4S06244